MKKCISIFIVMLFLCVTGCATINSILGNATVNLVTITLATEAGKVIAQQFPSLTASILQDANGMVTAGNSTALTLAAFTDAINALGQATKVNPNIVSELNTILADVTAEAQNVSTGSTVSNITAVINALVVGLQSVPAPAPALRLAARAHKVPSAAAAILSLKKAR